MAASTLNVSLTPQMRDYIDARVASGDYATPSDYIRSLVRLEKEMRETRRLDALVLEGLASGITDATPADREHLMRAAESRIQSIERGET